MAQTADQDPHPVVTGADDMIRALEEGGIDLCLTNPGTSEMHAVAALDRSDRMRCVLALFEGVATGAADGYFRMARRPAATLLHLGPGFANGMANLHNAKKAGSGVVNVVGDHASFHLAYNAPLTSDIAGMARTVSHWVQAAPDAAALAEAATQAVEQARIGTGRVATLIAPADATWSAGGRPVRRAAPPPRRAVPDAARIAAAAATLRRGGTSLLLLGGSFVSARAKAWAAAIAQATGCALRTPISSPRNERGAGRVEIPRVPYAGEEAIAALREVRQVVLCGARRPVSNFAFPDRSNVLTQRGCTFVELAEADDDIEATLAALADAVGVQAASAPTPVAPTRTLPTGAPTPEGIARTITALLPENAVVVDEAVTTGRGFARFTADAQPHDWLQNVGGSIGYGMPVAIGAALACPDRRVLCLAGDGSAMYTEQALWTMAREALDITVVIMANRAYQILRAQLPRVGIRNPGQRSIDMLTLDRPALDWVGIARGHGVEAGHADDLEGLARQLQRGFAASGPYLVELRL